MLLSSPPTRPRRLSPLSPQSVSRVRLASLIAALIVSTMAFVWAIQAVVTANAQAATPPVGLNPTQLPSWYASPLSAAQLHGEVAIPQDLNTVAGPLRLTTADYTNGSGGLAIDAREAVGKTLIAGESIELPGNTIFSLSSHLPVAAARAQLARMQSALRYVSAVTCEGYTDYGFDTARPAIALGMQRARMICGLLHDANPQIATTAASFGSSRPALVGGGINVHRAVNRRVVITITRATVGLPDAPVITSATGGNATIALSVTPPDDLLAGAEYQYSLNAGKTWSRLVGTGASTVSGTIRDLTNGHTYMVIVRVIDAAGISLDSQRATATPAVPTPAPPVPPIPPTPTTTAVPTTTTAPATTTVPTTTTTTTTTTPTPTVPGAPVLNSATPGDSQATFTFTAPVSDSTDQPTGYEISTDGGTTWTSVTTTGSSPYTVTVIGLTNGTQYTAEVRAVDGVGDSSPSNSLAVTPAGPPDAATVIDASYATPNGPPRDYEITLIWTASPNTGGAPITGWEYSQTVSSGGTGHNETDVPVTVTQSGGMYQATFDSGIDWCTYTGDTDYTVQATNSVGTSVPSNVWTLDLESEC